MLRTECSNHNLTSAEVWNRMFQSQSRQASLLNPICLLIFLFGTSLEHMGSKHMLPCTCLFSCTNHPNKHASGLIQDASYYPHHFLLCHLTRADTAGSTRADTAGSHLSSGAARFECGHHGSHVGHWEWDLCQMPCGDIVHHTEQLARSWTRINTACLVLPKQVTSEHDRDRPLTLGKG